MKIDVTLASLDEKPILQRLMELYLYDFSQFEDSDLDARGCYGYEWLDAYWSEKGRYPFLVRVDGKLAGFVLINPYTCVPPSQWAIAEFFVMRRYRRRGVGKRTAFIIFDMFRGKWEVRELENNIPAQHFWRRVISAYTGGQYIETSLNNEAWLGPVQCFDNSLPQSDAKMDAQMSAAEVISLLQLFRHDHINVCVDGGWGVDALLGEQTRPHADLDIALEHKDVPLIRALLEARGYLDVPREDTRDCNFVMGDAQGHLVDIHSYTFDAAGMLVFGVAYPFDSLNGAGSINGQPLKCISPEWMVKFHSGYPLDENDYHDVKLLCRHFVLPLPAEYAPFVQAESQSLADKADPPFHQGQANLQPAQPE